MNENSQDPGPTPVNAPPVPGPERRGMTIILSVILAVGLLLYAVCLFKNISYPLMWADESMTAVGAERVLDYGYPKVHDGRNIFYDLRHDDMTLGIDKKTDAYIGGAGWAPYYFAAPFAALARLTSDIYQKTAILRIPFAAAGLAGLLLLLWTGTRALPTRQGRLALAVLFVALELTSVTFMLHLREVRYYSLDFLMTAVALHVFAAWHLFSSIRYRTYAVAVVFLVPLLFLTFSPASVAFCITLFLYLGGEWVIAATRQDGDAEGDAPGAARRGLRAGVRSLAPLLASLVLVAPLVWFFRTLYISRKLDEFYGFNLDTYLEHLNVVWGYFARWDIIVFAIAAKVLLALFRRRARSDAGLHPALKLSLLLSLFFVAQALLIGKIPNRLYVRYFIMLQPLLILSFALDLSVLARIALGMNGRRKMAGMAVVTMLLVGSAGWEFNCNKLLIEGRLYEISHRYKGVLDFVIPYIQDRYKHPDRLIIATNYEETSYIYYLGCRVIVGFLTPNLKYDLFERPDCIIYRTFWEYQTDKSVYDYFLRRDPYEMVRFPVYDYGFNNIPESAHWAPGTGWQRKLHLFMTLYSDIPEYQATLYVRKESTAHGAPGRDGGLSTPSNSQPRRE